MERAADRGAEPAGKLCVAGFKPHRGTDAARPHRLQRDDHAAAERHPAAIERIGLDRVDLARRTPAHQQQEGDTEHQPAQSGNQQGADGVDPVLAGQPLAPFQVEQHGMQHADHGAHGGHHEAADHADYRCQQRKAGFMRADEDAQPLRGLKIS